MALILTDNILICISKIDHFPSRVYYDDWRKVTIENIEPRVISKLDNLVLARALKYFGSCPVCGAIKLVFENNFLDD
jgi:hypothetical protein